MSEATNRESKVPADQGLSTLGLAMQLMGTVLGVYALIMLLTFVFIPQSDSSKVASLLILVLCGVRSWFHARAGSQLIYGQTSLDGQALHLAGIKRYVVIALVQSMGVAGILLAQGTLPVRDAIALGAGLAVWPVILGVVFAMPRFARFKTEMPMPEDKGFEGAAILMTILGVCGSLAMGAVLVLMLQNLHAILNTGPGVLLVGAVIVLFIRSLLHVGAGLSGLRETDLVGSIDKANRYANFGVIASFCAAGALLIVAMMDGPQVMVFAWVACMCWMLLAWPLTLRRFIGERQFAGLTAADTDVHRRAPDLGLTGLGWILIGHAAFMATYVVPQLCAGGSSSGGMFDTSTRLVDMFSRMAPAGGHSIWWTVVELALQLWAGFSLIRMTPNARWIATGYAIVVSLLTVWMAWPVIKEVSAMLRSFDPSNVVSLVTLAIGLVIPASTLLLVNRALTPTARARFTNA
ncbi:MAG TPA: hypothetical protein VGM90_10930 [Kofleriaceae bacterium]